jgi:hypothetical protein
MVATMFLPDFLIIGKQSDLDSWPIAAKKAGLLSCYNVSLNPNAEPCSERCVLGHGCGISKDSATYMIVSITRVEGLETNPDDSLLLMTPSKRNRENDIDSIRELVRKVLKEYSNSEISCFESISQGDNVGWRKFT